MKLSPASNFAGKTHLFLCLFYLFYVGRVTASRFIEYATLRWLGIFFGGGTLDSKLKFHIYICFQELHKTRWTYLLSSEISNVAIISRLVSVSAYSVLSKSGASCARTHSRARSAASRTTYERTEQNNITYFVCFKCLVVDFFSLAHFYKCSMIDIQLTSKAFCRPASRQDMSVSVTEPRAAISAVSSKATVHAVCVRPFVLPESYSMLVLTSFEQYQSLFERHNRSIGQLQYYFI